MALPDTVVDLVELALGLAGHLGVGPYPGGGEAFYGECLIPGDVGEDVSPGSAGVELGEDVVLPGVGSAGEFGDVVGVEVWSVCVCLCAEGGR